MSNSNGVIRISRKGRKKFAFGEYGEPGSATFEVDVVSVFHGWNTAINVFRQEEDDADGNRPIPPENLEAYHEAAVSFVEQLRGGDKNAEGYVPVSTGEAMDFFARLREAYDDLVVFMRPKLREERDSPATSEGGSELRFSEEKPADKGQRHPDDQPVA